MADHVLIGGLKIPIATAEEAEACAYVVCCTVGMFSPFLDNVHTNCLFCGADIFHRPTAPKRPPKICIPYATQLPLSGKAN